MTTYAKNLQIGDFRLVAKLGSGESGEVWSAVGGDAGEAVALKICKTTAEARRRAEYEYAMASKFSHSNILHPHSLLEIGGRPVIVMPLCAGRSVDGVSGCMSEAQIWKLLYDVSGALAEVHKAGYGHFDIKPSNILWSGKDFIVSDFGSCRRIATSDGGDTASDKSSFRFDAPEIARGEYRPAGDIWSLGASAFFLYMGTYVFNGLGGRAQKRTSPLPYMRKSMPELSELICRCLSWESGARPSAEEIADTAFAQMKRCGAARSERPLKPEKRDAGHAVSEFWPDRMM